MSDDFQYDVFLSHSSKDKAVVRVSSLSASNGERAGVRCRSQLSAERLHAKAEVRRKKEEIELQPSAFRLQPLLRDPLNRERRFIPLRLDDAPIKGSLAQFLYINWRPADREQDVDGKTAFDFSVNK